MQENLKKKIDFLFLLFKIIYFVELLMEGEESRIVEENFFEIKIF